MITERKTRKRPFYSFLLFDDESPKTTVTAATAASAANPVVTKVADRPQVSNYPVQEPSKQESSLPTSIKPSADAAQSPKPVVNPVFINRSNTRLHPDSVIASYLASKDYLSNPVEASSRDIRSNPEPGNTPASQGGLRPGLAGIRTPAGGTDNQYCGQ